jgi:LacI family kdg operon repressor
VARSLNAFGLIWGSDIGLLGFDELEWAELAGVGITTQTADVADWLPPSSRWFVALKANDPVCERCFPAS